MPVVISDFRAVLRRLRTAFCAVSIAISISPLEACAEGPPADRLRLLSEHGIEADTPSLVAFLERLQPDEKRRAEIAKLLGQLSDLEFAKREAASKKLSAFGEAARSQLEAALTSQDPEVRMRAGKVLAELDSAGNRQLRHSLNLAVLEVLKSKRDPEAVPALLAVIAVLSDLTTRNVACEALWACTAAHHADELVKEIDGEDPTRRAAALVALEVAGGENHVEEIAEWLASDEPLVRLAAARALIDRRPRDAIETLIPLTDSNDQEIAWQSDALLQLKTGKLLELSEQQTLSDAWKTWAAEHLATAKLDTQLGPRRLDLSAGRNQLEETFSRNQASVKGGFGRFSYTANNGGDAKVVEGKLRFDGNNPEGDQRLFITSQKMIGRERWPDRLEVTARLSGENGNNYGWHLGISVGRIKSLFHPGISQGAFRAETTDDHASIFSNEDMGFTVETGVTYEMTVRAVRTEKGAEFDVSVKDEKGGAAFRRRFSVTHEQLGDFNRIGLERSGQTGAEAVFDSVAIRLGR